MGGCEFYISKARDTKIFEYAFFLIIVVLLKVRPVVRRGGKGHRFSAGPQAPLAAPRSQIGRPQSWKPTALKLRTIASYLASWPMLVLTSCIKSTRA